MIPALTSTCVCGCVCWNEWCSQSETGQTKLSKFEPPKRLPSSAIPGDAQLAYSVILTQTGRAKHPVHCRNIRNAHRERSSIFLMARHTFFSSSTNTIGGRTHSEKLLFRSSREKGIWPTTSQDSHASTQDVAVRS